MLVSLEHVALVRHSRPLRDLTEDYAIRACKQESYRKLHNPRLQAGFLPGVNYVRRAYSVCEVYTLSFA